MAAYPYNDKEPVCKFQQYEIHKHDEKEPLLYYYRCIGSDAYRFGGERICYNKQIRSDYLEQAVRNDVYEFLTVPERIENEFKLRLSGKKKHSKWESEEKLQKEISKIKRGINKLIDAYTDELLDKEEFSNRIKKSRDRLESLTIDLKKFEDEVSYKLNTGEGT